MAHQQPPAGRSYRMSKRAEDMAATRQGIVEAAVRLHATLGPAATTISALAEAARVTRLTVYRHFPEADELFTACSEHWASSQTLPDPLSWQRVPDPAERLGAGLADLYRFYADGAPMLTRVRRDRDVLPKKLQDRTAAIDAGHRDILLAAFDVRGATRRRLRAVLGHAVSFWTWQSLCIGQGLSQREAVKAMTALAMATAEAPATGDGS